LTLVAFLILANRSAIGSVRLMLLSFLVIYHDALTIPGISPFKANSRKHNRHKSNFR
jgi:hypothetical protein